MDESLVSCPNCELMAHHHLQLVHARPNPRAGDSVEIMRFGSVEPVRTFEEPDELPAYLRRLCVFCGHEWGQQLASTG